RPDPWAARDAYVDVVIGTATPAAFGAAWLGPQATGHDRAVVDTLMSAQRWRLAMFASCGWFWDRPDRPEPIAVRRAARYAARLIDRLAGTNLVATLDPALSDDGARIRRASVSRRSRLASCGPPWRGSRRRS
ncbi:MAG: DUF3536 domain-containing protein, partial [Solirubrobacterales bacterium]